MRPRFFPVVGKVLADPAEVFFSVAFLVGDPTVVAVVAGTTVMVGNGTIVDVVEVGATVVVGEETGSVFDDIVNIAPAAFGVRTKSPAAVQFPGDAHETEDKYVGGRSDCTPLTKTAGRARSHTPSVDVMVNAALLLFLFKKAPTAVQFPGDAHDTEVNCVLGKLFWIPLTKTAGRASSHTPLVDVIVNASVASDMLLKFPTAVQLPGDAHDTE